MVNLKSKHTFLLTEVNDQIRQKKLLLFSWEGSWLIWLHDDDDDDDDDDNDDDDHDHHQHGHDHDHNDGDDDDSDDDDDADNGSDDDGSDDDDDNDNNDDADDDDDDYDYDDDDDAAAADDHHETYFPDLRLNIRDYISVIVLTIWQNMEFKTCPYHDNLKPVFIIWYTICYDVLCPWSSGRYHMVIKRWISNSTT